MKVLGMLFIVWGHLNPEYLTHFIYTFSVPSFFFISGYLFKVRSWPEFIKKNLRSLIIPYLLLGCSVTIFFAMVKIYFGAYTNDFFLNSIVSLIIGDQKGSCGGVGCQALWFVYTLFLAKILSNILREKWTIQFIVAAVFLGAAQYFTIRGFEFYSSYANLLVSYPFFLTGFYLRSAKKEWIAKLTSYINTRFSYRQLAIGAICLTALVGLISHYNGMVEMFNAKFGSNIFLFILGGIFGSMLLAIISMRFGSKDYKNVIKTISTGSILILAWQIIFLLAITLTIAKSMGNLIHHGAITFILSIAIMLIFIPVIKFANIHLPFLVGYR